MQKFELVVKKRDRQRSLVGRVGVEPTQCLHRRILSPLRLPIPPPPRNSIGYFTIIWCFSVKN